MKKQGILYLATFVAFMLLVSCSSDKKNEAKDAALNNMNDSINYALGIGNGFFIKSYYLNEVGNEEAAISAFIDALDKGYGNPKENDEMHNLGIRIGSSFKEQEKGGFMGNPDIKFDYDLVKKGLLDGLKATGESTMMEEADLYIRNVMGEIQENQLENPEGKISLSKERVDSLNYSLGLANGFSLKTFYLENEQPTQEMMNSLIAGIDEVANNKSEFFDLETLGENLGSALKAQEETGLMDIEGITVNLPIIKQALINGMKGYENQMNERQAEYYMRTVIQMQEEKKFQEVYGDNKRAGEEFLAENAKNSDVVVLPSGLQYKIIKEGNGEKPNATSVVNVHYHGTLIDGTVFDSSVERGKPTSFGVNQVISGWTEALQLMPVGSKWMLYIPQNLAYGAADRGTIKPYSALIFEVELLGIEQ